jgi:hypothetical protein
MGLDQAIRKMTPETAQKVREWQSKDWEDLDKREENEIPEEEYRRIEEVWVGRKENHIHRAVEEITGETIENCDYLFLTKRHVELLVSKLNAVSADHTRAAELLPPQDGFFFGGTDINEWYFRDIEEELEAFEDILEGWDENAEYAYWAWW